MAKNKAETPAPPDLKKSDLGEIHRLAAGGDETEDVDWEPGQATELIPLDKRKPKKEKPPKEVKTQRPRQPVEIRSGKIHKTIFCHFTYDQNFPNFVSNEVLMKSGVPIHEDMKPAFDRFVPHLALIFQEIDDEQFLATQPFSDGTPPTQPPIALLALLGDFTISAFRLEEYDEEEAIVLMGERTLEAGPAKLETPPIFFTGANYKRAKELRIITDGVIFEILEYLHGRKRAPETQLDLFTQANN